MMTLLKRTILGALAVVLLTGLAGTASAFAASPWWHLSSGSHPADIQPGVARNDVQEITVEATGGTLYLASPALTEENLKKENFFGPPPAEEPLFVEMPFNASAATVQEKLESLYGAGNVRVTGGLGGEGGAPYKVEFVGPFVDQPVALLRSLPFGLEGGKANASIAEQAKGQPDGQIVVTVANLGDASANGGSTPVQVADRLPNGVRAVSVSATVVGGKEFNKIPQSPCSLELLTCTVTEAIPPYAKIEMLVDVVVEAIPAPGEANEVSVSGGEAASASFRRPLAVGDQSSSFGVEDYELTPEEEGGALDTQAGSHPFQLTTTLALNSAADGYPVALTKDLNFNIPPGLIGNPTVLPQCTLKQFLTNAGDEIDECAPQTALGLASVTLNSPTLKDQITLVQPLFNLEPAVGEPARFGFYVKVLGGETPVILDTSVRTGGDYGVTVSVNNIVQTAAFESSQVTFWGVPGDSRHDNVRGWSCLEASRGLESKGGPCDPSDEQHPPPFLSLPTACTGPLQSTVETDSWEQEGVFSSLPVEAMPSMDGCNRLPFTPSVKVTPDGQAGSTPTGLTVDEHVSQLSTLAPEGLAESDVKGLSVTLPQGVVLNPAAADGLQACSQEQIGLLSAGAPGCPEASKVATVKIKTPLLPEPLEGAAYLAAQNANPFGSLVALYVYAEDPISGVRVKAAGEVLENPVTGQLIAHFEGDPVFENDRSFAGTPAAQFLPELAFEDVELHFFGGDRAPLVTPSLCGSYTTTGTFTPWSGNRTTESSSEFQILSGPNGSPCQNPLPFSPSLTSGSTNINAGAFTPLTTTVNREDGQQSIQQITLHYPPGVSGMLSGVPLCPEAQANAGTCGQGSLIGSTIVSVGVGGDPYSVTGGQVFLTEKIAGSPADASFGLSIVNPAVAGPFNLGKVVVRAQIAIDPHTAALTVTTGQIPHILDGIPLQIKHINVTVQRPNGFTLNPTDCNPMSVTGTVGSVEGASAAISDPFQVTNCTVLKFAPKFAVSTSGKTSKAHGASLHVKLTYPAGSLGTEANLTRVKVDLPKQLPSRLTTLQKACTNAQFEANPADCPSASIIGYAKATVPNIPVPLEGPAYFVSHGGEAFPSLIIVLQGYGVTVDLVGSTFISKAGITSSTFKTIPDAPVSSFELTLPEGKYSALAANGNLCASKLAMPTEFLGQNGAKINQSTPIGITGCAKKKALTRAQKLAAALKACHKQAKGDRSGCEKTARKRYGPVKGKKKK